MGLCGGLCSAIWNIVPLLVSPRCSAVNDEADEESMPQRIDLCSASEVAPGNALKVETGGLVLAGFNIDGEVYVTGDLCTHGPGSLYERYIAGALNDVHLHN